MTVDTGGKFEGRLVWSWVSQKRLWALSSGRTRTYSKLSLTGRSRSRLSHGNNSLPLMIRGRRPLPQRRAHLPTQRAASGQHRGEAPQATVADPKEEGSDRTKYASPGLAYHESILAPCEESNTSEGAPASIPTTRAQLPESASANRVAEPPPNTDNEQKECGNARAQKRQRARPPPLAPDPPPRPLPLPPLAPPSPPQPRPPLPLPTGSVVSTRQSRV